MELGKMKGQRNMFQMRDQGITLENELNVD